MFRTTIVRNAALVRTTRPFSTSMCARKDAASTVKDAAKSVDRTISDNLVKGIDKTAEAANSLKGSINSGEVKQKAEELTSEAKQKAGELSSEAQKKANVTSGQVKGAAHEAAGKARGTAEEAKSKLS